MPSVRQALCMAQEMGARLGECQDLFGTVQGRFAAGQGCGLRGRTAASIRICHRHLDCLDLKRGMQG
jgi:hypothetical protein